MPENSEIKAIYSYAVVDVQANSSSYERTLNASVHDALWGLSIQWRLKEFQGEDAGSSIYARVHLEQTKLTRFKAFESDVEVFDNEIPMEAQVEREKVEYDLALHLQLARYWRKLLKLYDLENYLELFTSAYPIAEATTYHELSNEDAVQIRNITQSRSFYGGSLLDFLTSGSGISASDLANEVNTAELSIESGDFSELNNVIEDFKNFYNRLFSQPESDSCWNKKRLEYSFESSVSDTASGDQTVFESKEYQGGKLDWYDYEVKPGSSNALNEGTGVTINDDVQHSEKMSVIPMNVSFPGMPLDRWWEMQNGQINYGAMKPSKTGLLAMMVRDFMVNYNNDWSLIPYTVPVGSFTKIKSIVVKDVFGDHIYVGGELPPPPDAPSADDKWSIYKLNKSDDFYDWDERLFVPPAVPQILEGDVLDKVNFFRDQMANMAWAVENRVPNELGGYKDGTDAQLELKRYLEGVYENQSDPSNPPIETDGEYERPSYRYKLMAYVPENWIPLIPQHKSGSSDQVNFQRATLPRIMENKDIDHTDAANYVQPRTKIMREGLDYATPSTYQIYEEEIPRAGIYVTRNFQRCRWHNGRVFLWMGRYKKSGRGEGLSGLVFDSLEGEQKL